MLFNNHIRNSEESGIKLEPMGSYDISPVSNNTVIGYAGEGIRTVSFREDSDDHR